MRSYKAEWDDNQVVVGTILIIAGAMMILFQFEFLVHMLGRPFSIGTLYVIEFCLFGTAIFLTGVFTIIKLRTKAGIIILGLGSTILGGSLVILTLMSIIWWVNITELSSIIFIVEYEVPILITGMVFLLHGQILMIKKQKSMKLVWYVLFFLVGLTIIICLFFASIMSTPFFDPFLALYLELLITIPIISYFCIEKVENERTKLVRGVLSILVGGFILIISIISVIKLNIVMNFIVALIFLPLSLIFYGIFVIFIVIFSNNLKS